MSLVMEKKNDTQLQRLNKIIAMAGIASRRRADELITSGQVEVNHTLVTQIGSKARWGIDSISVNGKELPGPSQKIYIMLNKPFGYVSTLHDPQGRNTIIDLIKNINKRVFPVGRLDFDSHGLLILTNDGEAAYRLMHPSYHIPRTYKVIIEGYLSDNSAKRLKKGLSLDDGLTTPSHVRIISKEKGKTVIRITIFEGRSREIRRMFEALGHKTIKLIRTGYGNINLGDLKVGKYRLIEDAKVKALRKLVGLD